MNKKIAIVMMLVLFTIPITKATDVTDCQNIGSSGTYNLLNDIYVTTQTVGTQNDCIRIQTDNVVFDLKNYGIYNRNTTSILVGIRVTAQRNVTIQNGVVSDFLNTSTNEAIAISHECLGHICDNFIIDNIQIFNSSVGLDLINITNSNFKLAINNPTGKFGILADQIRDSTFLVFVRSQKYGMIIQNVNNSVISGHFDTDVMILSNITTYANPISSFLNNFPLTSWLPDWVIGGGSPSSILTPSQGIALMVWNTTYTLYKNIYASGWIQGIAVEGSKAQNDISFNSSYNIFEKIELPLSYKTKGYLGALYLGFNTINNTFCEVDGLIYDDCGIGLRSCDYKQNYYFSKCTMLSNIPYYAGYSTVSNIYLTPLFPEIASSTYSWVAFLTTPFFLSMMFVVAVSMAIMHYSHNSEFGFYSLVILVLLVSMVQLSSIWFGLIFIIVMSYIIFKSFKIDLPFKRGEKNE